MAQSKLAMEKERVVAAAKAAATQKELDEHRAALKAAERNKEEQLALQKAQMQAEANAKLVGQANQSFAAQLQQLEAQVSDSR